MNGGREEQSLDLFTCLFNDGLQTAYIILNVRMSWTLNCEGCGRSHGLLQGTIPAFSCSNWEKSQKFNQVIHLQAATLNKTSKTWSRNANYYTVMFS